MPSVNSSYPQSFSQAQNRTSRLQRAGSAERHCLRATASVVVYVKRRSSWPFTLRHKGYADGAASRRRHTRGALLNGW
jgi:hypothetical protein